ncbi:MAG: radical SAM protein [Acidobacteriota bacterium]
MCLVTALTVADFIDPDLIVDAHVNTGAQLGVLTLAALLRDRGHAPVVVNLDDLFFEFIGRSDRRRATPADGGPQHLGEKTTRSKSFFAFVAAQLRPGDFDVFGLSSICSSYPLTLRLANAIKRSNPLCTIVGGGPQASVADVATLRAFPSVDIIVRGEADDTFPTLLHHLAHPDAAWQRLGGITFRRGDEIVRNPNAPVVENLDRLPLPAFDLDSRLRQRGGVHLEIGRGCPFACTFCSTNDFFRRNFRLKSPARMVADMSAIHKEYGLRYFSLVHDMYTIDRKEVMAFCEAMLASGEGLTWGCSARTDCIDDELLALMARAGCTGIFFGIETGSQRLQQVINKQLDLAEAKERIACADRHGINTTVALIVGFPEETRDDLRDTIHFFVDSLRYDHVEPQCSLLAPLAATPIYEQHRDHLIFDDLFSDMSHQSWQQDPVEAALIKAHPAVFPNFYAIPMAHLDRREVKDVVDFVTYLATWFRWLPVVLLQDSGDLLLVFERWRRWRAERSPVDTDEQIGWTPYHSHRRFHTDLLEFVHACYLPEMARANAAVRAVARAEQATIHQPQPASAEATDRLTDSTVAYCADGLCVVDVEVDYKELIECLRNRTDLDAIGSRNTTIVFSRNEATLNVWQLPALSAALLRLCDGHRTVGEVVRECAALGMDVDGIPPEKVCLFGLMQLKEDGFIRFSSSTLIWDSEAAGETTAAYAVLPQGSNTQQPWPVSVGES